MTMMSVSSLGLLLVCFCLVQMAVVAKGNLERITNKVYFDVDIGGSEAGRNGCS
jgi:hypothetical protein